MFTKTQKLTQKMPRAVGPAPVGGVMPLSASGGQEMQVVKLHGHSEQKNFLESLGFVKGADVRVVSSMGGNMIVEVKGARMALDASFARHILVAEKGMAC